MKQILVDIRSAANLLYFPALLRLTYKPDSLRDPIRILVGFNGSQTGSLSEIVLSI